jgi:hypothetical protein
MDRTNRLTDARFDTRAALEGQRQDQAEENLRERRLAELRKDEVECRCGQWYVKDEGKYCEICFEPTCGQCMKPAKDPISGKRLDWVCESCRERVAEIAKAEAVLAHRDEIVAALDMAMQRLHSLGNLPSEQWPAMIGRAWDQLHTLRDIYLRKAG